MFDQRLVDIRNENEELRSQIAWLEFGPDALNRMLAEANDTGLTEVCRCAACFLAKRFSPMEPEGIVVRFSKEQREECVLQKCLRWHAQRQGLDILFYDDSSSDASDDAAGSQDSEQSASDMDCHIVIIDRGQFDMWEVDYGKKLSPNRFHANPDLPDLQSLFALIDEGEDFFRVGDTDYRALAETDS
jgi:hypothetical protein